MPKKGRAFFALSKMTDPALWSGSLKESNDRGGQDIAA
jgi:hypothetical protein